MVMSVVCNLTALVHHSPDNACIGINIGAQHEEGSPSAIGLQAVQYPAGHGCLRSVVKCKCNHGPGWVNSMGCSQVRRNSRPLCRDGSPYAVHPEAGPLLSGCRTVGCPVRPGTVLEYLVI